MFKKKLILLLLIPYLNFAQEIDISKGWKFNQGDDINWSKSTFDDRKWKEIELNRFWEFQGYEKYDGYAWYRKKVFIPSSLKQNSYLKDSIKILLGKIDDHDQTFLNGEMIGENGGMRFKFGNQNNDAGNSAYAINRRYTIPVNHKAIKWDAENIISIRVFDQLGNGGMGDGQKYTLSMVDEIDYVKMDINQTPFSFQNDGYLSKTIYLKSVKEDEKTFSGTLKVEVIDIINSKTLATYSLFTQFNNKKTFAFTFSLPSYENAIAKYSFEEEKSKNRFEAWQEVPYILTPIEKSEPQINSPKVYGVKPNNPFLFTIPASGERPITFSTENLPSGLKIDAQTGIITGTIKEKGEYKVKLIAKNLRGEAKRELKIVVGDKIALTPPMGWNSWNCWGLAVSDEKVRASAKAFIEKGLINYGWTYMNIDDGWEAERDANGVLQPNEKFPDMKKLADDLHGMGLKLGIYSSPGPKTCGGYTGSYNYDQTDINTWANWGIDYVKYDWCSYSDIAKLKIGKNWEISSDKKTLETLKKPYHIMQKAISNANRDIYYSLCQYGWGEVWKWGNEVNGQSWRTTGDIEDTWKSMAGIGFGQAPFYPYAKPGNWNDPDMLVVGSVGWGPKLHDTRLTVNEQYTHISLWSLLSAPLLIGCDMASLDDFTLSLLKNAEVIALNQDPLGKQAQQLIKKDDYQVWVKDIEDGSKAVGIFNMSNDIKEIKIDFNELKLGSDKNVRDIWRGKELGNFKNQYSAKIMSHGVNLIKVY